jgi:hypothetical protein
MVPAQPFVCPYPSPIWRPVQRVANRVLAEVLLHITVAGQGRIVKRESLICWNLIPC